MTIDLPTLATIVGILATLGSGAIWFGRVIVRATRAATLLTARMEALEATLVDITKGTLSREDFAHWLERLGYRNPALKIPEMPEPLAPTGTHG